MNKRMIRMKKALIVLFITGIVGFFVAFYPMKSEIRKNIAFGNLIVQMNVTWFIYCRWKKS